MRRTGALITGLAALALACAPTLSCAQTPAPEQLNSAIQAKAKELAEIQKQLEETQKSLSETQVKGKSLNQELGKLKTNIKQLDLGIKANTVKISSLSLEIGSLEGDIRDTEKKAALKADAVSSLMKEIQQVDEEDPLIVFVKSKTLADAVGEQSHLAELNGDLGQAIAELKATNEERKEKLDAKTAKKKDVEGQYRELTAKKGIVEDVKNERQQILAQTKNQEKAYQQMVSELAKKQADIAAEIEAIDAQLRAQIDPNSLPTAVKGVLSWPTPAPKITQGYGGTPFALRGGYKGHWHNGLDFGGAYGSPIIAAADGVVLAAGNQDAYCPRGAYGKFAIIRHNNNLVTLYGHMSQLGTQVGQLVKRGDVIGYMGKTGYALGTHLHFTVYDGATFSMRNSKTCGPMPTGGDLDPQKYL